MEIIKKNTIQNLPSKHCVGCNACGDICPKQAITFETDIEGFWYPEVDNVKCNDCGLCEKVCPIINIKELKKNDLEQSVCYAAEHKNIDVVFDSTSGGAFSALADIMYKEKGYVGGAVFNEDFSIKHHISNDKQDLPKLRSSKYAQSDLCNFYNEVKRLLANNEKVLVCGCPCQMSALRAFLQKDYENLIIADFICRGINSPKVWRKYLDSFEERYGSPVVYAKAKSKEYGWRNLTQKVILADGQVKYETKDESQFTKGYLNTNAYCRPSCYDCKFKEFPRIADITLADFWGIEKVVKTLDKDLGISMIMLNSQKGVKYFEEFRAQLNYIKIDYNKIFIRNLALTKSLDPPKIDRELFFIDLDKMTFAETGKKHFNINTGKVGIIKQKLKPLLSFIKCFVKETQLHIIPVLQTIKYSNFFSNGFFISTPYSIIEKHKTAKIILKNGNFKFGVKGIRKSKLETRILLRENATLDVNGGYTIFYGGHIEIHKGASLIIKSDGKSGTANINCTIICADKIEIGKGVMIGRGVTIRDNNGGHYINRYGYENTKPVIIGDKVWLCEGCTIMAGARIGDGAIIGAYALVTGNVPAYAQVASGNPARIIDKDVLWKY